MHAGGEEAAKKAHLQRLPSADHPKVFSKVMKQQQVRQASLTSVVAVAG